MARLLLELGKQKFLLLVDRVLMVVQGNFGSARRVDQIVFGQVINCRGIRKINSEVIHKIRDKWIDGSDLMRMRWKGLTYLDRT